MIESEEITASLILQCIEEKKYKCECGYEAYEISMPLPTCPKCGKERTYDNQV